MYRLVPLCALLCFLLPLRAQEITLATLSKNGNIRYGPSLKAGVITTLRPGTEIEMFGEAEGKPGWYRIRFPRQGHAWIHRKVVQETEQEGLLRVVVEGARVRADATIASNVVTDLAVGDEIEWKGQTVGDWYAVYPPMATAYVYRSVLDPRSLQPGTSSVAVRPATATSSTSAGGTGQAMTPIARLWHEIQELYADYHAVYQRDRVAANSLDWKGLLPPLARIVDEHPDLRTRLVAQRLRTSIVRMLHAGVDPVPPTIERPRASASQATGPASPVTQAPSEPAAAPPGPEVVQPEPEVASPEPEVVQPEPVEVVADPPAAPSDGAVSAVAMPEGTVVEGWLEERDIPGVGSVYVILGDQGVAAFVEAAEPGLDLRQLFWRRVRVTGAVTGADQSAYPAEYRSVPTLRISDIRVTR